MAGKKVKGVAGLKDTSGGIRRDDRQASSKFVFEPISIDAENATTVIYMLLSPEGNVVLRAIASLDRFGSKATENLELLSSLNIYQYILGLVHHEDYLVKRFAQKLIGELCSLEVFREQILSKDENVALFIEILEKEEDVVMHEFSSLTLALLSGECAAAGKIIQMEGCVDILHVRLSSADPDVQKNCLDIMKNLMGVIDGVQRFIYSPHFDMKPILELTTSQYPLIQITALEVIDQFMTRSMDNRFLFALRDALGIEKLLNIVDNVNWVDLHLPTLEILLKITDNPEICEYLHQSGCLQRMITLLDLFTETSYTERILGILARISQLETGRKALHSNNVGEIFGQFLQQEWSSIQEPSCLGIANMARYPPALEKIMSTKPTTYLLGIITDSSKEWKLREIAAYALNVLSHEDYRAAEDLLEESRFEELLPLLEDGRNTRFEVILNILQIFTGISSAQKNRIAVANEKLIGAVMQLIQYQDERYLKPASVQVAAMECLSSFMIEELPREYFHNLNGAQKLIGCLKNRYTSIRQWAAFLVTQLAQNSNFVKAFIHHQGLKYLLDDRNMRYSIPSWESAIEAVFKAFLPAKFAYTGRLDLHDLTQEGFYILRRPCKLFFVLDDLLEVRASPAFPIYVANFEMHQPCTPKVSKESMRASIDTITEKTKKESEVQKEEPVKDLRKFMAHADRNTVDDSSWDGSLISYDSYGRVSVADTCLSLKLESFGSCPNDPYLPAYLSALRKALAKEIYYDIFRDPKWIGIHPKLIRQRAQMLARFVAEEMSGPDPDPVCKQHYLQMHLNDIRYDLGTNVIPLGFIKIGSYLERAMLFKILADRIGLPCALVRGSYGRAWVEIAIPVININLNKETKETQTSFPTTPPPSIRTSVTNETSEETDSHKNTRLSTCEILCRGSSVHVEKYLFPALTVDSSNALPTRLLKPNALVDLIFEPGRIMPINSYEAAAYRGDYLFRNQDNQLKCRY